MVAVAVAFAVAAAVVVVVVVADVAVLAERGRVSQSRVIAPLCV